MEEFLDGKFTLLVEELSRNGNSHCEHRAAAQAAESCREWSSPREMQPAPPHGAPERRLRSHSHHRIKVEKHESRPHPLSENRDHLFRGRHGRLVEVAHRFFFNNTAAT